MISLVIWSRRFDRSPFADADFEDLIAGCANQGGEDCRNVGRRASLLAGLPVEVAGPSTAYAPAATLASVRPDDLLGDLRRRGAEGVDRSPFADADFEDLIAGCANQGGEDCRNVGRRASLLAGLPVEVAGMTVNRLCASGLAAVLDASRAIACGQGDLFIAGRRGEHESCAVRHGEGGEGVRPTADRVRLDARIALRKPADDHPVRRPRDARDIRRKRLMLTARISISAGTPVIGSHSPHRRSTLAAKTECFFAGELHSVRVVMVSPGTSEVDACGARRRT